MSSPAAGGPPAMGAGREFDLVRRMMARWGDVALGIGDDAAVLAVPPGERLVVSTDASVEDVHFRRGWITPHEIGWRATSSALSDLAAMAATPLGLVVALSLPDGWRDDVDDLADGIGAAARAAGTVIVGGDLVRGRELALTVTVFGSATRPLGRGGARVGDRLYVTGTLGGPHVALRAWQRGETPSVEARARFARPAARLAEARWLAEHGATAMVDVSDGLAADLGHVAAASGARLVIDADVVPRVRGAARADALGGGEEYEVACTASAALDVAAFYAAFGILLTEIGRVESGPSEVVIVDAAGCRVEIPPGHDHLTH